MDVDDETDADLLRAYGAGDQHAFARLYDRYDRALFLFIRRLLGAAYANAVEDLHQETWVSVAKNAKRFDPALGSFAAWLFTISRRKVFDHFRREKIVVLGLEADPALGAADERIADLGKTPLDRVQSREQAETIIAAVEALPLEQRGVLVMFVEGELSLAEIAEVMGVTAETAKSRLRYARAKLRQLLGAEKAHV